MEKDKINLTDLLEQSDHTDKRNQELEKARVHIIVEIIEYVPSAPVSDIIIKKTTGNITVTSFDTGEESGEKTAPFNTYIQVIDGAAEVIINEKKYLLRPGNGIVIPAHEPHCINANERFKMISTVIKSVYGEA
jgi:quercetin dioxygenase-like cupin family protein